MRRIYCDCCKREIMDTEPIYNMEIKQGQDKEIVLEDMCIDCFQDIERIIDNAGKSMYL